MLFMTKHNSDDKHRSERKRSMGEPWRSDQLTTYKAARLLSIINVIEHDLLDVT